MRRKRTNHIGGLATIVTFDNDGYAVGTVVIR